MFFLFDLKNRDVREFFPIRQISAVVFHRAFFVEPRHRHCDGQVPKLIGGLIRNPPARPNKCLNADVVENGVPVEYRDGPFEASRNREGAMVCRATPTPHGGLQPIHG